ncbi:MAG: TCR/Tet family MFS transporter [Polymorphobacter sp.]|uniref:TCR/Tet family MFS transporter n=1 Tax=Polymorphobacter sp. TaxID=1909290 RepID=UPI003A867AE6
MNKALAFIFATVLIDAIGFGVIVPVMPGLIVSLTGKSFAGAAEVSGMIMLLYAVTQFICGPVIGGLSDRFGRRPVLLASLLAFGLDYLVMAFAPTLAWLVVARFFAGVTGASFSTAYAYIADISPPEKRGPNFGLIGMAFGLGFIIGPALGGIAAEWGERVPFFLAAALALGNAAYGFFILPESLAPEHRRPFDWRRANPVGALMRFRRSSPTVLMLGFTVLIWTIGYQSLFSTWNYYTIERFGWSPGEVGWSLAAVGLVGALVQGLLSRRLIPRFGARNIVVAGVISGIFGYLIYAFAAAPWVMYVGIVVAALQGLVFPSLQSLMSAGTSPSEQGELQGGVASLQSLAAIFGPPMMTQSFAAFSAADAPIYFPGAPYVLAACCSVIALMVFSRAISLGAGRPVTA